MHRVFYFYFNCLKNFEFLILNKVVYEYQKQNHGFKLKLLFIPITFFISVLCDLQITKWEIVLFWVPPSWSLYDLLYSPGKNFIHFGCTRNTSYGSIFHHSNLVPQLRQLLYFMHLMEIGLTCNVTSRP